MLYDVPNKLVKDCSTKELVEVLAHRVDNQEFHANEALRKAVEREKSSGGARLYAMSQVITQGDTAVTEIGLSGRTCNCLRRARILYLSQLVSYSKEELMSIRSFGKTCLDEVEKILESRNLLLFKDE